ncbi:MAG: prepilin-type N-terminal cleavage/methylation domain-containing protein [Patescibacteria group bacterium]
MNKLLAQIYSRNKTADNRGFTLIELLIYMGLVTIILLVLTNFAVDVTANAAHAKSAKEVQQNARILLASLSQEIRTAKTIQQVLPTSLTIISPTDETIVYSLSDSRLYYTISGITLPLNNDRVRVTDLSFAQTGQAVSINLTVEQGNPNTDAAGRSQTSLSSTIVPRRQLY